MDQTGCEERLREALATDDRAMLREAAVSAHPADLAGCLDELDPTMVWNVLRVLPDDRRAETFGYLQPESQVALARTIGRGQLASVVSHMSGDERADLYNRLDPEQQMALLPALAQAERDDIRRLASYPERSAGAIMTSDYATLSPGLTAAAAVEALRLAAPDKETIYQAFVIDDERRLIGTLSLRELILTPAHRRVEEAMVRDVIAVRVDAPQAEAAEKVARYDLMALPVVDADGRLVGIVTYDDAMDVAEQEATEDFQKSGSVGTLETSVRRAGFGQLYRKRVFWLVLLVFGNLISGAAIARYEDTISTYVALVIFLPLLVGSSGNAGSQAATLTVRALATGDVQFKDWGRMLLREVAVAAALGLTMAVAIAWVGVARGGTEVGLVVALTMVLVVIVGSLVGMSLPFLLNRFGFDPATASAPLVATMADIMGVIIYFAIATRLLSMPPG